MSLGLVNAVTLKEMRQSVRGMFISILLTITLIANGMFICSELIFNNNIGLDFTIAQRLFSQIYFILMIGSFILIPAYIGNRFSSEISDKESSLFFSTTLKPAEIVWGKFCSGAMLVVMFYCATLPFLVLLYFLRGLDVVKMLMTIFYSFIFSLLSIMFMLAFNSDAAHPGIRRTKNAVGVISLLFLSSSLGELYFFVNSDGASITTFVYWAKMLTYLGVEILAGLMLFLITVYKISPKFSNRALPIKIYTFIFWLLTGIIALAWSRSDALTSRFSDIEPLGIWLPAMTIMFVVAMVMSAIEPNKLSKRVRAKISKKSFVKTFQYIFYSGCASTFIFCGIMAILTIMVSGALEAAGMPGTKETMITIELSAMTLYGLMYGLTTITIKRHFFKDKPDTKIPAIITLILILLGTITPVLIAFYMFESLAPMNNLGWYVVGNPFIIFSKEWPIFKVLAFTSVFTIVLTAFNWKWFYTSFKEFHRPEN
ncbi:MAG: ABC transporter permease [Sedimentisphaeraceae bacterium JB056]